MDALVVAGAGLVVEGATQLQRDNKHRHRTVQSEKQPADGEALSL